MGPVQFTLGDTVSPGPDGPKSHDAELFHHLVGSRFTVALQLMVPAVEKVIDRSHVLHVVSRGGCAFAANEAVVAPDGRGTGTPLIVVLPPPSVTVADPLALAPPPQPQATEMLPEIVAAAFPLRDAEPLMCGLATT